MRRDIEQRSPETVDGALVGVEGVYAFRVRGPADNEMGVGMRGFSGRANGQARVLVLLDGQPINNSYGGAVNWTALPLGDVDRIEVVRGPFSSLYGGSAMGGVIQILTRPIDRRSVEVSAQYGTHDTALFSARSGVRLGHLGLAGSIETLNSGGYPTQEVLRTATDSTATGGIQVTGVTRYLTRTGTVNYAVGLRGNNTYDRYSVRARGEYTLSSSTFASVQFIRQSSTFGWDPYTTTLKTADGQLLDTGTVVFQDDGVWKRMTVTPSNYLGVVIGGASNLYQAQVLHSAGAGGEWRAQVGLSDAPRDYNGTPGATATLDGGPGSYSWQANRGSFGNVQWSRTVRSSHALTFGVDGRRDRASIQTFTVTDYINGGSFSPRETFASGNALTWAAYAQDAYAVSSKVGLTFGGRYDYWRTYNGASQKAVTLPTEPYAERSAGAFTGKVALVMQPRTGTVIRTSAGTAFRSPSVIDLYRDTRLSSGSLLLGNAMLDPETMKSWELGIRQDVGAHVALDAAYYDNRIRNLIFRSVDLALDPTGLTSRNLNAGRARSRGVELSTTVRAASWFTLTPSYTFSDSTIVANAQSPQTVGKQIPFVPRHTAAAIATATTRRLTLSATARYQSAVFATDTNTDTTKHVPGTYDAFFETDVAATLPVTRHVSASLSADNLFDTHYYLFYRNPGRLLWAGVRVKY